MNDKTISNTNPVVRDGEQGRSMGAALNFVARFSGDDGRPNRIKAVMEATLVRGDQPLAEAIADASEAVPLEVGEALITEKGHDTDLYFILAGKAGIIVKGVQVNERGPGDHVGEIAALDPTQQRSATVVGQSPGAVLRLPEPALTDIAERFPAIWRRLAIEQAKRLVQRNDLVRAANDQPIVFIISSVEALTVAQELQSRLTHADMQVTLWTDGVFRASDYPIPALQRAIEASDFAIAVIDGDDTIVSRETTQLAPRDNVTFELGLFMGKLDLERTILVEPRNAQIKLASDLRGITTLTYRPGADDTLESRIQPVAHEISKHVRRVGVRRS
ncbi:MAG: TIR domain-containing protein [Brevundimonas sp.]